MRKPIVTFATLTVALVALTGCLATTANIEEVKMGTDVDSTSQEITSEATDFSPEAPIIYASIQIANAPADSIFIGAWMYEGEEFVESTEIEAGGNRYIAFSVTNEGLWPEGEYEFKASIKDTDKTVSIPFTVKSESSE